MPRLALDDIHDLLSGRRRGCRAALLRAGLSLAELPYRLAVRWRNRRFDRGRGVVRVAAPVVSVGNLTTGGVGKTPLVAWIVRYFRQRGVRVAIVSRGYGAESGGVNDEALELEQQLPDAPHVQNRDRVAAARLAIDELAAQLLVLDDAFQHRRLARDVDLVMLDALEPFGYGRLLPRGLLREPLAGLGRASAVLLSRADQVDEATRAEIWRRVARWAPAAPQIETRHQPHAWLAVGRDPWPLDMLRDQPVAAFCGIGNPDGFRRTLHDLGCRVIAWRTFPDHHPYGRDDVTDLRQWLDAQPQAAAAVCTHKDLVKLGVDVLGSRPLRALSIRLDILRGEAELTRLLAPLVDRLPADSVADA